MRHLIFDSPAIVRIVRSMLGLSCLLLGLSGCGQPPPAGPPIRDVTRTRNLAFDEDEISKVYALNQGWTDKQARWFYEVSQGSRLLPYTWFKNLEQPDSTTKFLDDDHIRELGYLPRKSSKSNPDGLPIGFSKDEGEHHDWVGLNCAACHTAQINYGGKALLIDGAPSMGDLETLLRRLEASLERTLNDPDKFQRFAELELEGKDSTYNRQVLKMQLTRILEKRKQYNGRNLPKTEEGKFGYARVDAFAAILNEVTARFLELPANARDANAPVSFPFLWDTPHHDKVQWNGSAPNASGGDLARNVGEVLGVFGDIEIPRDPPVFGYRSTVQIRNLRAIEKQLKKLTSPQWPAMFGAIDHKKADAGKVLFDRYCVSCHENNESFVRNDPDRKIIARMDDVKTDPQMDLNFQQRVATTGRLEGSRINFNIKPFGDRFDHTAGGDEILVHVVVGTILGGLKDPPKEDLEDLRFRNDLSGAADAPKAIYKARPLNGIWATAPYLHNGSVSSLYQLLLPAKDREKEFWVGRRDFDPKHVGFDSTEGPGLYHFKTNIDGNLNVGHEYGTGKSKTEGGDGLPALTGDQRWQLLEYLKRL